METAPPSPARAARRWKERNYVGMLRERQLDAWALPAGGGALIGPADLLRAGAEDRPATLSIGGADVPLLESTIERHGRLAILRGDDVARLDLPWLSLTRLRAAAAPEDCAIIGDPQSAALPISAGRMSVETREDEIVWAIDPSTALDESWHGAAVVSRQDGAIIGITVIEKGRTVWTGTSAALDAAPEVRDTYLQV